MAYATLGRPRINKYVIALCCTHGEVMVRWPRGSAFRLAWLKLGARASGHRHPRYLPRREYWPGHEKNL